MTLYPSINLHILHSKAKEALHALKGQIHIIEFIKKFGIFAGFGCTCVKKRQVCQILFSYVVVYNIVIGIKRNPSKVHFPYMVDDYACC